MSPISLDDIIKATLVAHIPYRRARVTNLVEIDYGPGYGIAFCEVYYAGPHIHEGFASTVNEWRKSTLAKPTGFNHDCFIIRLPDFSYAVVHCRDNMATVGRGIAFFETTG